MRIVRSMPSTARTWFVGRRRERVDEPAADREVDLQPLEAQELRGVGRDGGDRRRRGRGRARGCAGRTRAGSWAAACSSAERAAASCDLGIGLVRDDAVLVVVVALVAGRDGCSSLMPAAPMVLGALGPMGGALGVRSPAPARRGRGMTCSAGAGASRCGYRWQATRTPSPNVTSGGTTSRHTSITNGQRAANRHPGGGSRRSGGEPGITSSVRRSAWMLGNDDRSFCVYGCRGALKTRATGPSSATLPAYMTITRSQVSAITDRSWVISISDSPRSRRSCSSSWRICAWTITSRAVVGSSPMTIAGSHARAIAIIARWRIPPDSSCG